MARNTSCVVFLSKQEKGDGEKAENQGEGKVKLLIHDSVPQERML